MNIYLPMSTARRLSHAQEANRALRAERAELSRDLRVALAECQELRAMLGASIDSALARCLEDGAA